MSAFQTTIIAILVLLVGGVFLAGCHRSPFRESRWRDLPAETRAEKITARISHHLDLDDAQKQQVKTLALELIEEGEALRTANADLHSVVAAEMRKAEPDPARIESLIKQKLAGLETLSGTVSEKLVAFHAILTAEQRRKLADEILLALKAGCGYGVQQ